MQFTITLEQLMAAGLVLTMAILTWVSSRNRKLAEQLRKEAHEISENAKRDIEAHHAELAKREKAQEHAKAQWKTWPAHIREQVRNMQLMAPVIQSYQETFGDELKCMVVLAETKDGSHIRLYHPEAFRNGPQAVKWSEGNDKELLLMMARGIGQVERAESGIIDVLQVMLDEQKDLSRNEAAKRAM